MKATRTLANRACRFGIAILMLLVLPHAAQAACTNSILTHTDGRVLGPYFITNAGDLQVDFRVDVGRSYVVEAMQQNGSTPVLPVINVNAFDCPTNDAGSGVTIRDIGGISPLFSGPPTSKSLVVLGGSENLKMRVGNPSATPTAYVLSVVETTMFSPGWSTFGVNTFWSFYNTTNATINGTLSLLSTTGGLIGPPGTQAIPPGTAWFPSTITMLIGANMSGTARFTHDGPPGAILAEAAITNFASFFQRVRFDPRPSR